MDDIPNILMVEDNLGDAVLLREYLSECRFACVIRHCRMLSEAQTALAEGTFQIVLLDLILPDSKGMPTFNAVHKQAPGVPIVILTGFADEELASQAVKLGAQDYLPKDDINGTQLTRTIRYAIERKRAEQVLHQAKEAAEAANKAKDRFLASLSHELRTPLTPVLTQVQMLERDPQLTPELREAMGMIRRNIELEARLIDDLLDLTRVTSGKMELRPQVVDVHRLIRHSIEICRRDIDIKHIALDVHLSASEATIRADPDRLQQVFWNLLINAVKFTPATGRIRITTANPKPGRVSIAISDTGVGIDPEVLPRIFEAFEQGGRTITRKFGGLGLGLAITRSIVNLHEGTLVASSEGDGKGSSFTVDLKTVVGEAQASSKQLAVAAGVSRRLAILLVEDDDNTAKVMSMLLRGFGHDVFHARTVETAVERAAASPPDLLISDIGLPDGTGHDVIRRIRERMPQLKAVVISGYGTVEDVRESLRAGFAKHLTKPFGERALLDAIAEVTNPAATGQASAT